MTGLRLNLLSYKCQNICNKFKHNHNKRNSQELLIQIVRCLNRGEDKSKNYLSRFLYMFFGSYCFDNYLKVFILSHNVQSFYSEINFLKNVTINYNINELMGYNLKLIRYVRNLADINIKSNNALPDVFYSNNKNLNMNYAILLNMIGRTIPSLRINMQNKQYYYNRPEYYCNVGLELFLYAWLLDNPFIRGLSLRYINKALSLFPPMSNKNKHQIIVSKYAANLINQHGYKQINNRFKKINNITNSYNYWVVSVGLLLNPLNDVIHNLNINYDNIQLSKEVYKYCPGDFDLFNLIKQKYTVARYNLYLGIINKNDHSLNKYSGIKFSQQIMENDHVDQMKIAFRLFYSIFDSISCLINNHFHLGINPRHMSISFLENNKNIRKCLNSYSNDPHSRPYLAFRGIYWISQDIYDETKKDGLDYNLFISNRFRNALAHRGLYIVNDKKYGSTFYSLKGPDTTTIVSWTTFRNNILHLARVSREVIILTSIIFNSTVMGLPRIYFPNGGSKLLKIR